MSTTTVSQTIRERFQKLKDNSKAQSRHLSNVAQISLEFSYQSIIGMGPEVVPLILAERDKEPDQVQLQRLGGSKHGSMVATGCSLADSSLTRGSRHW